MGKIIKRITNYFSDSVIDVRIRVSKLFILFIVLLPAIAYFDMVSIGRFSGLGFWHYFKVSLLEIFILFLGYTLAKNERKK